MSFHFFPNSKNEIYASGFGAYTKYLVDSYFVLCGKLLTVPLHSACLFDNKL